MREIKPHQGIRGFASRICDSPCVEIFTMNLDDKVCLCFHVTRRKLVNFVRIHEPVVASQLAECGGAGTGCGWCVPFLKQIFRDGTASLDDLSAEAYARQRAEYVRSGNGTPPPGATPLPENT